MTSDLPDRQSPDLAIMQMTKEEILTQAKNNAVSWRGPLSLEAYIRREEHLAQQSLTKNSGITFWALVDTSLDPKDRRVLAGCETLRKHALIARLDEVQDVTCHGICSVFTPKEFRGRGYGARLIQELGSRLSTWQTDKYECIFSILYSDIGKVSLR